MRHHNLQIRSQFHRKSPCLQLFRILLLLPRPPHPLRLFTEQAWKGTLWINTWISQWWISETPLLVVYFADMQCQHAFHQINSLVLQNKSPNRSVWYYFSHLAWRFPGIVYIDSGTSLLQVIGVPNQRRFTNGNVTAFSHDKKRCPSSSSNSSADFFLQKAIPQEPQFFKQTALQ